MTEQPVPDDPLDEQERSNPPPGWEVPEIVGMAGLASVAVLVVGGLATGIARAVTEAASNYPPGQGSQEVWNAMTLGTEWAGPLVAVIVLGAFGLCWWQIQAWAEVFDGPADDDDLAEAHGHVHRAHLIARWAMVALALTAAGSIAGFVAQVGQNAGQPFWTVDIYTGANLLAVFVLLGVATLVNRQLQHQPGVSTVAVKGPE